jgi:hypothetical protein
VADNSLVRYGCAVAVECVADVWATAEGTYGRVAATDDRGAWVASGMVTIAARPWDRRDVRVAD